MILMAALAALLSDYDVEWRWGKYPAEAKEGKEESVRLTAPRHWSALHIPASGSWISTESNHSDPRSDTLGEIELQALSPNVIWSWLDECWTNTVLCAVAHSCDACTTSFPKMPTSSKERWKRIRRSCSGDLSYRTQKTAESSLKSVWLWRNTAHSCNPMTPS